MSGRIYYLVMVFEKWSCLEATIAPGLPVTGPDNIVGFCPIYEDAETAKAQYPGKQILAITADLGSAGENNKALRGEGGER